MEFLFRNELARPSHKVSCSSLGPREPGGLLWAVPRLDGLGVTQAGGYLGGREVCQPPLDVQRVPAGRQAALLQRPHLRRRPGAARDHLVEVELQGSGVFV